MDFSSVVQPDSNNDAVIGCKVSGITCQIQNSAVPTLQKPFFFSSPNPILPLSSHLIEAGDKFTKELEFPILCDIFHDKISHLEAQPAKCPICGSFLPLDSLPSGTNSCPFCNNTEIPDSFIAFPNDVVEPKFIILLIGNATEYFYSSLSNFCHEFIFLTYNDHFLQLQYKGGKFHQIHLFDDSEIAPNAFSRFPADQKVPKFPDSIMYKADLNKILSDLATIMPKLKDEPIHVIVFNSVPHICVKMFDVPNATLTVCSSNSFICECSDVCYEKGGLFLPHSQPYHFLAPFRQIIYSSIRVNGLLKEDNFPSVLFQGFFHVQFGMDSAVVSAVAQRNNATSPVQIVIKSDKETFVFTTTFLTKVGFKSFLFNCALPNMLLALSKTTKFTFSDILASYSKSLSEGLLVPHSLRHLLLFPNVVSPRKMIHRALTMRPFVLQILPVFRAVEFLSQNICTTISVSLILFENVVYIYVGSEVKKDVWINVIGCTPDPQMKSFEIVNVENEFQSDLWICIRQIRAAYFPYAVPVVVVPNESGRRVQLMQILDLDIIKGSNLVYSKYAEIARQALNQ